MWMQFLLSVICSRLGSETEVAVTYHKLTADGRCWNLVVRLRDPLVVSVEGTRWGLQATAYKASKARDWDKGIEEVLVFLSRPNGVDLNDWVDALIDELRPHLHGVRQRRPRKGRR